MKFKVGIYQHKVKEESVLKKIDKLENVLKKNSTCDLIIVPELYLSGYGNEKVINKLKEKRVGESSKLIANLCKKYSTAILYGYPEKYQNKLFNAAQFINHKGEVLANHRKSMLPLSSKENLVFDRGSKQTMITYKGLKIGIVICYELEFPELVRKLATKGTQLILAPTAQSIHWPAASRYIARSRAFENGVYVAYANFIGKLYGIDFLGESKIIGPDGLDLTNAKKKETVITSIIDTVAITQVRKKMPYLKDIQNR